MKVPAFETDLPGALALVPCRRLVVPSPLVRFRLQPGDRVLVAAGDPVQAGVPLIERTRDAAVVEIGDVEARPTGLPPETEPAIGPYRRLEGEPVAGEIGSGQAAASPAGEPPAGEPPVEAGFDGVAARGAAANGLRAAGVQGERRTAPGPGKWWVGGDDRRGRLGRRQPSRRLAGTLLFELGGRWRAVAGERHEVVESPVAGTVREARNGIGLTIAVSGMAIAGAVAAGEPARGVLRVPDLRDGELPLAALNVGLTGAIVVAGSRIGAEALTRARATAIRGIVAGSIGQVDLRDLSASEARQRASLQALPPFAALGLEGHTRRSIPTPALELLRSLAGREVALVTNPPLLVFEDADVTLPELAPDWVRIRSGALAGREGRWLGGAGSRRFRGGIHLESAFVRLEGEPVAVVPVGDLERFEV